MFREVRIFQCCLCRRSAPAISRWTCWSPASVWSLERRIICSGGSQTSQSTFWPCLCEFYLAVQLQKEEHQEFCNPRWCSRSPKNSLIRWVGHTMFLHLVLVDLVDRFANLVWVQPVALLEISVPFGIAHPLSSCIPLSQCKQLVVCRRRLHATVCGKIAILCLERVSLCTNIPYFDEVSKYFRMEQSSALSSRMESPPYNYHLPSGLL